MCDSAAWATYPCTGSNTNANDTDCRSFAVAVAFAGSSADIYAHPFTHGRATSIADRGAHSSAYQRAHSFAYAQAIASAHA